MASVDLSLSFVPLVDHVDSSFCVRERLALEHRRSSSLCRSTPGALAPVWFLLARPSSLNRPHPSHSQAHPDSPLRGLYEMPSPCVTA
jgi:hypothetical protein